MNATKIIEAFSKDLFPKAFCSNSLVLAAGNVYLYIYVICGPTVSKHLENLISLVLIDCAG